MERIPDVVVQDESKEKGVAAEFISSDTKNEKLVTSSSDYEQFKVAGRKGGDVNMEAIIIEDDVMRAGGFGARDDISSFLPVASDSTDFEASIRDAREYEEPQPEMRRPGLGWTETTTETK